MMLFLHIKIIKDPLHVNYRAITDVSSRMSEVTSFDVDNHSDAATIQTAVKAMQVAEKIFVAIEAEPGPELGGILKILNEVMKISSPVGIFYQGDHDMLNKIMVRFQEKVISDEHSLRKAVHHFFNP